MAEAADITVQQLFKKWRSGDAEAGQAMAQRFSDWYYAIAAVHLGDRKGRTPLDRACQAFAQGIVNIHRPGDLTEWAYGLIQQEVSAAGGRIGGADVGNALTGNRPPSRLLREARRGLDHDQIQLLHLVYTGSTDTAEIERLADGQGGMPVALLRARYTLKRLLRSNASVAFQETPLELDLDRSPLPLYEADRLANADEVENFEKWMLSAPSVCRDVAEFAAFSHAIRAGQLVGEESAEATPIEQATPSSRPEPVLVKPDQSAVEKQSGTASKGMSPALIAAAVGVVILVVLALVLLAR